MRAKLINAFADRRYYANARAMKGHTDGDVKNLCRFGVAIAYLRGRAYRAGK